MLPNNVNFFIWLGKSHSPRPIVGRAHHAAHSRRAALSCRAAQSRRAAPSHHALHWHAIYAVPSRWIPPSWRQQRKRVSSGSSVSSAAPSRHVLHLHAIQAAPSRRTAQSWGQQRKRFTGHHYQPFRSIKDSHLPRERGKETCDFCTGYVAPRGQRLGERQRRTAWWARHSKDTANDHLVQTCLY